MACFGSRQTLCIAVHAHGPDWTPIVPDVRSSLPVEQCFLLHWKVEEGLNSGDNHLTHAAEHVEAELGVDVEEVDEDPVLTDETPF